jgi:outer membrane scaffolding protein for murein synthesis (MipA/OmpV family)
MPHHPSRLIRDRHTHALRQRPLPRLMLLVAGAILPLAGADTPSPRLGPGLPSAPNYVADEGWNVLLGLGVEYEGAYDASKDYEADLEPWVVVHYVVDEVQVYLEGYVGGVRWYPDERWLVGVGARWESGREEDEDPALAGLGDVDSELMGTGEVRWAFDDAWSWWLAAGALAGSEDKGVLGVVALGHTIRPPVRGLVADVYAGVTLADARFIRNDFGISSEQEANSVYDAYEPDSGLRSYGIETAIEYQVTDHLLLRLTANIEKYSDSISDSPLVKAGQDYEFEVGLAVAWKIWQ